MKPTVCSVDSLFIYPLKSAGGIPLKTAEVLPEGFRHDRAWMVIDQKGKFMSQRLHPKMALIKTALADNGIQLAASGMQDALIPFEAEGAFTEGVVWDDLCEVQEVSTLLNEWISDYMQEACRIVKMKKGAVRPVDPRYRVKESDTTLFSDGFPYLVTTTASLKDLSDRTGMELAMIRFRPNIVVKNSVPFEEDSWRKITIGPMLFHLVKPCGRCSIVNVDPATGKRGDEPLKTLNSYRKQEKKILFGVNAIAEGSGTISLGDPVF